MSHSDRGRLRSAPRNDDPQVEQRDAQGSTDFALTRRKFLARGAVFGSAVATGGLLAACGGSGGTKTTASVSKAAGGGATASQLGKQLQEILGPPKNLLAHGPGEFKIDGQWPLTGAGAIYGKLQSEGWKFGSKHVEAWTNGKLKFVTTYMDNKSGNPQAEAQAGRQAGLDGGPVMMQSYNFGFGALFPALKQYKMLGIDPGGGVGPIPGPFVDVPYAYGARAAYPTDPEPGLTKMITTLHPEAKRFLVIQANIAEEWNKAVENYMLKLYKEMGLESAGVLLAPLGQTDYSTVIQQAKQIKPDVTVFLTFGTDPAYQAKEIQRQGMEGIFAGSDFTPDAVKLAGSAYKDWYFGFDYLNTVKPPSDWTKLFVDEFRKENGGVDPANYTAAYYMSAFMVATLMDRVIEAGGDIGNGDDYVKALESNPTFDHVYGGNGAEIGKMVIDLKTHSPAAIPMIGFQSLGTGDVKGIKDIATYNIEAREFKML